MERTYCSNLGDDLPEIPSKFYFQASKEPIFVDENFAQSYQPGSASPSISSPGDSTLFSFPGFGPPIAPRNPTQSQVFIQDGSQVPQHTSSNDVAQVVVNSARPVFSDSMFIVPERNFTGGDFKLLPPRTTAKMRRYLSSLP